MEKTFLLPKLGKGIITHTDQEVDGLRFVCIGDDKEQMLTVTGDEAKINVWQARTQAGVITDIDAKGKEKNWKKLGFQNRIIQLIDELAKTKVDLAKL